jgi:ketosteroid isomerase-like protein
MTPRAAQLRSRTFPNSTSLVMNHFLLLAHRRAVILPFLLVATLLQGCSGLPSSQRTTQDTADLSAQADRWDKAIVRKDRAAVEANMAQEFRQIGGQGNTETRDSFVEGLMAPELEIDPYTVEEFQVRLYGDVALLSGRTKMTGRYQGKPFQSHYRYIDIYVRSARGWKIVSVQISKIPDPA